MSNQFYEAPLIQYRGAAMLQEVGRRNGPRPVMGLACARTPPLINHVLNVRLSKAQGISPAKPPS